MKKVLMGLSLAVMMSGCSLTDEIPSFYDDNESKQIIDVVMAVGSLDCNSPFVKSQVSKIQYETTWLKEYSRAKGSGDVLNLVEPFQKTLQGIADQDIVNVKYCNLKRKTMIKQSSRIAVAIMGRY